MIHRKRPLRDLTRRFPLFLYNNLKLSGLCYFLRSSLESRRVESNLGMKSHTAGVDDERTRSLLFAFACFPVESLREEWYSRTGVEHIRIDLLRFDSWRITTKQNKIRLSFFFSPYLFILVQRPCASHFQCFCCSTFFFLYIYL